MKTHLARIAELPCAVCSRHPVQCHHAVSGSIFVRIGPRGRHKHSDYLALPLCHEHHQGANGIHTLGVATFERKFGFQSHMIDLLGRMLGMDLWAKAREELESKKAAKKYKRGDKVLPRRFT